MFSAPTPEFSTRVLDWDLIQWAGLRTIKISLSVEFRWISTIYEHCPENWDCDYCSNDRGMVSPS